MREWVPAGFFCLERDLVASEHALDGAGGKWGRFSDERDTAVGMRGEFDEHVVLPCVSCGSKGGVNYGYLEGGARVVGKLLCWSKLRD